MLDLVAGVELLAQGLDGDVCGFIQRKAANPGSQSREGNARHADLAMDRGEPGPPIAPREERSIGWTDDRPLELAWWSRESVDIG